MTNTLTNLYNALANVVAYHGGRYNASQIIGAETDEALKTVHARLGRWEDGNLQETVINLALDLERLGFELTVKPIKPIAVGSLAERVDGCERAIADLYSKIKD